jgi:hypothetical protein
MNVGGDLLMSETPVFYDNVDIADAKVVHLLDLSGTIFAHLNLAGVDAQELLVVGLEWWCSGGKAPISVAATQPNTDDRVAAGRWRLGDLGWRQVRCTTAGPPSPPILILRNAHVGAFQDSADAWPPAMDLEGFHYDRLGGRGGSGRNDMRQRLPEDWTDWLARDPIFSTQPYTQLSLVLLTAGNRDASEAIQFNGRERERGETRRDSLRSWLNWLWLTFFSVVAGYGVGLYTFRVLWWVLGLTVLVVIFRQMVPAEFHSLYRI